MVSSRPLPPSATRLTWLRELRLQDDMHEILQWKGLELVVRSDSVDRENIEWMGDSLFLQTFQAAPVTAEDFVMDLGAHVGSFAVLAAKLKPGRVCAFEPDPESFSLCRINSIINSLESRVSCHPVAVGGTSGKVILYEATENWGHTTYQRGGPHNVLTGHSMEVACLSLADAIARAGTGRCAFMKFNIEGAEADMLENADSNTLRRIAVMVGEIHYDLISRSPETMLNHLADSGFRIELTPLGEQRALLLAKRM
jgi:FkbM family methyltransferase